MSRSFSGNTDHLDNSSPAVTAVPLTISAWLKFGSTGNQILVTVGVSGTGLNYFDIGQANAAAPIATTFDGVAGSSASSTFTMDTGVWHCLTAVYVSATSRAIYVDGTNKGTNAVSRVPAGINATRISGTLAATPVNPILTAGLMAHVAIWNTALSDSEVALLATLAPTLVRPESLLEYWPLNNGQSPEPSYGVSPHQLSVTGTGYSTDNPVLTYTTVPLLGQMAA